MAIQFDKKVKCGAEYVALRMLDRCDNLKIGDIYIPQTSAANERLGFYVIEDIGSKAAKEYGLAVGDYVLADRLSSFGHTEPVALMRYNNIICKTDKDRTKYYPLKNMVFVKQEKNESVTNVGGIYVQNYAEKLNIGIITDYNVENKEEFPFEVGDKVLLVKNGDIIQFGNTTIVIYKPESLICKFED